ncbi:glycine-rich domain-containing protein 1-like isoform X2 [Wolffia australiana]
MEKTYELEWEQAQRIVISADLLATAKFQLKFLAAVDKHRYLYEGPVLNRAIDRYKNYWLPLIAQQDESSTVPLLVPLDCEWIWHCHRLNPLQYIRDCEREFGRIIGSRNVISTVGEGPIPLESKEIWIKAYPHEPFEIDYSCSSSTNDNHEEKTEITYDLVSAVKRQSSFFDQVSRPSMNDDNFLNYAVARYKGFLHLRRRNQEQSVNIFQVPTYDIDLIWHSHQLHPQSYSEDLLEILGRILPHDDTDSDRSKGKKLDVGFSETTKRWEEMFGRRYWRAGAMYKGNAPAAVVTVPPPLIDIVEAQNPAAKLEVNLDLLLPSVNFIEVLLEILEIRNLKDSRKASLSVLVRKKQPDPFFNKRFGLPIFSESGEKRVASFRCEPSGDLLLTVVANLSSTKLSLTRRRKLIGKALLPLSELVDSSPDRCIDLWLNLKTKTASFQAVSLRVAASSTCKAPGPHSLVMAAAPPAFALGRCFTLQSSPSPRQNPRSTSVLDESGKEILCIRTRKREVVAEWRPSNETQVMAELRNNVWAFPVHGFSLRLDRANKEAHLYELKGGTHLVRLYLGRKLEFDPRTCAHHRTDENNYITAVQFSSDHPYGRAVALINVKSAFIKVSEDSFLLPAVLLTVLLRN